MCVCVCVNVVVAVLWAGVLLFGALPLFGLGSFRLQYPRTWCFLHFRATTPLDMAYAYAYAVVNLLVVVVMVVCNALVMTTLCHVRKQRRRMSNASVNSTLLHADVIAVEEKGRGGVGGTGGSSNLQVHVPSHGPVVGRRRHQRDVELQMIWLLCAITTIFSVCWVPLMVCGPVVLFSVFLALVYLPLSLFLSVCLSFFLSIFLSVCLSVCLSFCLSFCLSVCLSFCLSVCLSFLLLVYLPLSLFLSVFLSFYLSFCLSFFLSFCLSFCLSVFFLSVFHSVFFLNSSCPTPHHTTPHHTTPHKLCRFGLQGVHSIQMPCLDIF